MLIAMRVPAVLCLMILALGATFPASALVPSDLLDMRSCGIGALSPDGRFLIYTVSDHDQTTVHWRDLESDAQQVLFTPDDRANGFCYSPDGRTIAFKRRTDQGTEVWLMGADGSQRRRVAGPGRFGALNWSPDGRFLAHLVSDLDPEYEGRPGTVTVADGFGWRHLGQGEREGRIQQLHLVELATGEDRILAAADLDVRGLSWSPDSRELVLSAKRRRDLGRTLNTDLFVIGQDGQGLRPITSNPGPDDKPIWLDDETIAYQSHGDSLHESEPAHLVLITADGKHEKQRLLQDFDNCVWGIWHHGDEFFFRGARRGTAGIFKAADQAGTMLTPAGWNCWDIRFGGDRAVIWANSQTSPGAIFTIDLDKGEVQLLLDPNDRWSQRVGLVEPQRFEVTVEDRVIEGWVFLPEGYEPGHRLPTVLSIHGGPEWMYGGYFLPEFHVLPAFGYAVLAANPTGSTGYGSEFQDAIRGDWNGRPAREVMAVVDHAVAEGWSDPDFLAVMGGSYGGHLAATLTTQTDRFKAAACDRMYPQTEAFWGATDEKWFPEWEMGGRPFDPEARETYRRNNPFNDIAQVRTPTLLSHGLLDFRCPQDGTVTWYSALQSLGVPTRLLRFHDEGHGIKGRDNQIFYLEQLLAWFERHVLEVATP